MNADISDTDNSDEFEGSQVLTVPHLTQRSLDFWASLIAEKTLMEPVFSLAFVSSGEWGFVVYSPKETVEKLWEAHEELLPVLRALNVYDNFLKLSGPLGQSNSRRAQ